MQQSLDLASRIDKRSRYELWLWRLVQYFVLVTKREKRACRSCEDLGVVSAPLLPRIIEKCLASDRIVIETVVCKYCNHTPLHRQSMILERDLGLEISRATTSGGRLSRRTCSCRARSYRFC